MKVVIDGVEYVPKADVPKITDKRIFHALESLTAIQYFSECSHKHRAWAWEAMFALAPELAEMAANNPEGAFNRIRENEEI